VIDYPANFAASNNSSVKEPRFTVEIAFDNANTDLWYLTSHADCEVPTGAANVVYGCLKQPSGTSQKLNPLKAAATIGSLTIPAVDVGGSLTAYIGSKLGVVDGIPTGDGLRGKRIRIYIGYADLAWADYVLPPGGTQLIQKITYNSGLYTFLCNDVQRTARKNIFVPRETTLKSNVSVGDTTITVADSSAFEMLEHDASYGDAPNSTVGYIKIEDEVIRYTGKITGSGTEQFTGCTRGVLGTVETDHEVDLTADVDRRTKVEEFIYLQGPVIKILYAVLTGNLWGQTGKTLPSTWHLNIDTAYIATAQFTSIGNDLWNPSDPTAGFQCRGEGLSKVDGKKFYETELALLAGCFLPVTSTGELGLRRMSSVLHDAPHIALLDNSNIVSVGVLTHDMTQVHNQFNIEWNWDHKERKFTRGSSLIDQDSISTHGAAVPFEMKFKMLHGSTSTQVNLAMLRDSARDRYTGPPELVTVECLHKMNGIEIGDIVRLETDQLRDYVSSSDISRAFEVQQARVNWGTGEVSFDLFGSSQKADLIASSELSTVLPNSFYGPASGGIDISTVTTGTLTSGVWHITADVTLVGDADMNSPGAIFYYEGGVQIDTGVTVDIVDNVQFRFRDSFTLNGAINGVGGSTANYTVNTGIGSTESMGGLKFHFGTYGLFNEEHAIGINLQGSRSNGNGNGTGNIRIANDGSQLVGLPSDLRGQTSNPGGNNFLCDSVWDESTCTLSALGGNPASGGSGFLLITRSAFGQPGSAINISGADGVLGGSDDSPINGEVKLYAGSSGGGAPGAFLVLLDGSSAIEAGLIKEVVARQGNMPIVGTPALQTNAFRVTKGVWRNNDIGALYSPIDHSSTNSKVISIPPAETPTEDVPKITSVPASVNIAESAATNNTLNVTALEISVTPPSDGNYSGANVEIKDTTKASWKPVGFVSGTEELVVYVPKAVATYEVRAKPVSIFGVESEEYATASKTLTASAGQTVIGSGNKITTSPTTGNAANGQGVEISTDGIKGYNSSGVAKFTLDPATGLLTAVDGTFSGTVTATAGAVGGWAIASGSMTAGGLVLDSGNTRIRATNGANYTEMSPAGMTGFDSVLGITFNVPTDGSPPTFSSGIIKETQYEILSAGHIKTGSATGYLVGNGMWTGISGGVAKFSVGDPANEKYLAFDGTDVVLGRNSQIIGGDTFSNDSLFRRVSYVDGVYRENVITSGVSISISNGGYVDALIPSSASDTEIYRRVQYTSPPALWSKRRGFSMKLYFVPGYDTTMSGKTILLGVGRYTTASGVFFGFKIVGTKIYGIWAKAGTLYATTGLAFISPPIEKQFRVLLYPDEKIEFFVNGALVGTTSTASTIPGSADISYDDYFSYLRFTGDASSPDYLNVYFSESLFYQE